MILSYYAIFQNGEEINRIAAEEEFVKKYTSKMGYTYKLITVECDELKSPEERLTELEKENTLLKAQLQAQADRSEFIEDCIAEMAMQVYSNV